MFISLRKRFVSYLLMAAQELELFSLPSSFERFFASLPIQMTSSRENAEAQPHIKALQAKYPGKDMETENLLTTETQKLLQRIGC